MNKNDRPDFMHTLAGLAGHYNQELTAADFELWWSGFQNWSIEDFNAAAAVLFKRCHFMPKGADFEDLRRESVPSAAEAWGNVLEILPGGYRDGGIDELTDKAIAMLGGYRDLAMMPTERLDFRRREFVEAYESVIDAQIRAGLLPLRLPALPAKPKGITDGNASQA